MRTAGEILSECERIEQNSGDMTDAQILDRVAERLFTNTEVETLLREVRETADHAGVYLERAASYVNDRRAMIEEAKEKK